MPNRALAASWYNIERMLRVMAESGRHEGVQNQRSRWCWLVIVLAIVALSCSLATRTFRLSASQNISVHSAASQGMRQHLDRDAVRWIPPVRTLISLESPTFYPRVAPAGPPLPVLLLDSPLYNRPPPARG